VKGIIPRVPAKTKDRLVEAFLESLEVERNVSPRTLINYRHALESFRAGMSEPAWRELRADHFRRYLFDRMKAGIAKPTVRLHFAAMRTFYRWLVERHGLKDNPLKQVQLPKLDRKLPVVLSPKHIEALLGAPLAMAKSDRAPKWMPQRDAAILELFYSSGLRLAWMNSRKACAYSARAGRSASSPWARPRSWRSRNTATPPA
jgi:integrase/recombinase XerC